MWEGSRESGAGREGTKAATVTETGYYLFRYKCSINI